MLGGHVFQFLLCCYYCFACQLCAEWVEHKQEATPTHPSPAVGRLVHKWVGSNFRYHFQSILLPSLPFYILSAGGLIVAAITLCLPETGISNLPNTLEEGEQFGKEQPFLYLPFVERKKKSAK